MICFERVNLLPVNSVCLVGLGEIIMLQWALTFFIVALIAALLGFTQIAGTASWIAQVLFVVFLVLAIVSLLTGRRPAV